MRDMKIPEGWKEYLFDDIATFSKGKGISKNDINENGQTDCIRYGELYTHYGEVIKTTISKTNVASENLVLSKKNDIIIPASGETHIDIATASCVLNDGIALGGDLNIIRTKQYGVFLAYYLNNTLRTDIARLSQGISVVHLYASQLKLLRLILPPLPEQKAIADLLGTWDEAVEKTEKLIRAKEKQFKYLLRKLIGDGEKKGWEKVKLGEVLKESRILDKENNPQKRITVKLHLKGVEKRIYRGTESLDATVYYQRKQGQFIYGKQNIFKGAVGIVPERLNGYSSSQDIPAFDIDPSVLPKWLLSLFSYSNFYRKLEIYSNGSGSKRLHPKDLFQVQIFLPPIEEQRRIAEVLSLAGEEIDLLKKIAEKYKLQKRGLMQVLLSGRKRIRECVVEEYV